ncbi:MAG: MFS transporter [Anaerolineales bacterium]|nr:MFS transporter [Anaerolineales bacterium]
MASQTTAGRPVKLGLWYKVVWGVAALGTATISGTFGALQPIFFQDYLGLSARWITLAATIYAVWNAINDPLFGYITDSTRSKHGRRIPYMRFTAPFLALTFILVWFAPQGASEQGIFWWMLVTMLLYDTAYTIIGLVYSALLPEVSESDAERNGLQISSSLFGLLGTLLGFLIPDLVRPKADTTSLWPLQLAMIVIAITGALLIIATTLKVKERPEFTKVDEPVNLREALRLSFTSKSFLVLVAANFMSILMQALLLGSIFYLADYVLQAGNVMVVLASLFVPLIIGVPLTTLIRARVGVVRAQQILLLIAGVGLIALTFVPKSLMLVCVALAGFGLSGPQTLTNILFAQVADEDELRSGVRREGAFFGINALITKPAQSIALALIGIILERAAFVTREANGGLIFLNQPESALFGIKMLVGLIPGIAMLIGAVILGWYPLKGAYLQKVQNEVLELHASKHAKLEQIES